MIDTISIRQAVPLLPSAQMIARGFTTKCGHTSPDCHYITWTRNLPKDLGVLPNLTWSLTPYGHWLTVTVSLPKFLYNNNVAMVSDLDVTRGLNDISLFVSDTIGVPFDASTALVGRVDYCWNFFVGEANILPYISAASHATIAHMTRYQIGSTTITFKSHSKRMTIYGKHEEVACRARKGEAGDQELRDSVGLIRMEVSHYNSIGCRRLAKRYDLQDRLAQFLLVGGIAHNELETALEVLGLNKTAETIDARLDILREAYGDNPHCRRLVAFLGYLDRYGENFWKIGVGGYSRSAYYEYARQVREAGVWLRADKQLSPLRLVRHGAVTLQAA